VHENIAGGGTPPLSFYLKNRPASQLAAIQDDLTTFQQPGLTRIRYIEEGKAILYSYGGDDGSSSLRMHSTTTMDAHNEMRVD
jgi:hypothetical protein